MLRLRTCVHQSTPRGNETWGAPQVPQTTQSFVSALPTLPNLFRLIKSAYFSSRLEILFLRPCRKKCAGEWGVSRSFGYPTRLILHTEFILPTPVLKHNFRKESAGPNSRSALTMGSHRTDSMNPFMLHDQMTRHVSV